MGAGGLRIAGGRHLIDPKHIVRAEFGLTDAEESVRAIGGSDRRPLTRIQGAILIPVEEDGNAAEAALARVLHGIAVEVLELGAGDARGDVLSFPLLEAAILSCARLASHIGVQRQIGCRRVDIAECAYLDQHGIVVGAAAAVVIAQDESSVFPCIQVVDLREACSELVGRVVEVCERRRAGGRVDLEFVQGNDSAGVVVGLVQVDPELIILHAIDHLDRHVGQLEAARLGCIDVENARCVVVETFRDSVVGLSVGIAVVRRQEGIVKASPGADRGGLAEGRVPNVNRTGNQTDVGHETILSCLQVLCMNSRLDGRRPPRKRERSRSSE